MDPIGRETRYEYDAANRMTAQTMPDGRVVNFTYDANGNMTSITPPSRPAHAFTFDRLNQETEYNPPDIGLPVDVTKYEYNLDRDLTRVIRPDGLTINYNYDSAGRLSFILAPTTRYEYTYGNNGCQSCGGTDLPSSVSRADTATGVAERIDYAYDGNLVTSEIFSGTVNGSLAWTYDSDFAVKSLSINGGAAVTFTYDNDKALTVAGAETLARNATNGLLTGTTLGTVTDSYTYDMFGAPSRYTAKAGGAAIFDVQYTRDGLGRITRKLETIGGVATTYDYVYDLAGHLTGVKENGVTVSTYTYDQNGNRLSAVTKLGSFTGTYDDQDRMLTYGGATYTYTANGELKTKTDSAGVTTYDYDVFGNLTKVVMPNGDVIEYVIDAKNRRTGKKVNGVLSQGFIYKDQLEPVAELDGAGNVISTFVYASKGHVPDYMVKGGVTYRVVSDHLGSVRLVINTSDNSIAQRLDYDEFGNIAQDTNPGLQPFAFVGGVYENGLNMSRFGERDYDTITGRWTSKDPIRFEGDSYNIILYVQNDPVNKIDPSCIQPVSATLSLLKTSSGVL